MKRREFLASLGSALAATTWSWPTGAEESSAPPRVAITIDDMDLDPASRLLLTLEERNVRLLETLRNRSKLQAAVFVCGMRVDREEGRRHLQAWSDEGHVLGNHTYSHWYYPRAEFDRFTKDLVRGEAVVAPYASFQKLFRFPYLKEGNTEEQRDRMRAFLAQRRYRMGYVTIDASDWAIDARLRKRLESDPKADLTPYRDFYLEHLADRALFYEGLARKVLGRSVAHTILLHHNLATALFLGDLLDMFEARGWALVPAEQAFEDPIFSAMPDIAPAGESIVWALAKETGRFEDVLRYPAEDEGYEVDRMNELGL
jgi:peptidoglycan/xylan/chitin deacetylase (PgdA/CDA1 family)